MNDTLEHHGMEGMRWGIRRYQNKDGSLTKLGEKRYAHDVERNAMKKKDNRIPEEGLKDPVRWANEDDTRIKGVADAGKQMTQNLSALERATDKKKPVERKDLSSMSDKELRDQINRELLERQYNDMFNPAKVSKGREYVRDILETSGAVLGVASSALGIALAIRQFKG